MKISLNWLKEYVAFDWSAQQLAERLTMLGIEVEGIQTIGGDFPNVVVAQILASEKHPNADRLSVCRVTDGATERQIVCGAKNYKVGDKVPLALPNATLPNGLTIKISKLRGVESQGMLCSAAELKLAAEAEGLLILSPDARVGAPFSEILGPPDAVLDLEITPNRPDLLSHIGIAREIWAFTGNPLNLPKTTILEDSNPPITSGTGVPACEIKVEAPDLCPRYTARVIRGVKIGPSPEWLKQKLERIGARPINNVVDITNFVLYECGQPLHAFDLTWLKWVGEGQSRAQSGEKHINSLTKEESLLKGGEILIHIDYDTFLANEEIEHSHLAGKIIVRRARDGESIIGLDGIEYKLDTDKLVIADQYDPVCIAGIIGGQESAVNKFTTDILLESAYFNPRTIRAASKKLGVRSESSYRFERGADIGICDWASRRAAALIAELTGGKVAHGVIDTNPNPQSPTPIRCRFSRINSRLGIEVPRETMKKIFTGLQLGVSNETAEACEVQPPTFRVDLSNEADLSEEIGRIHGIEKIPAQSAPALPAWSEADAHYDALAKIRALLVGMGFWEIISPILVPKSSDATVALKNPLSEEMAALRGSLVGGLLNSLRVNVSRGNSDLRLFEFGRVFSPDGEKLHLALAIIGARTPAHWSGNAAKGDYYDLKAALEKLGAADIEITQLSSKLARQNDLRDPVYIAELDLAPILADSTIQRFKELPRFPSITRDIAMVLAEEKTHAQVVAAIREAKPDWLENVEIFDIFRGDAIGAGRKSVAYRLTFRAADRTLTDSEVNKVHEKVKMALKKALNCEIRE